MRTLIYFWLLVCFSGALAVTASAQSEAGTLVLQDGTPVRMRLAETVSSSDVKQGDPVSFLVVEDVSISGRPVIARGSVAMGTVTGVERKRRLGRGGKLNIRIDYVWQADGDKVPLRAAKHVKGGSHTGLMTGAMVGAVVVFMPATPVFALMHGQDCVLLKGTEVTSYVQGDHSFEATAAKKPEAQGAASGLEDIVGLLPTRVMDAQGVEGDMVNLVIVGSQDDLEAAFGRADWQQVDSTKRQAALHLVEERSSYRQMPMSKLYLFGRSQDYGYAISETMISRRHHVRIWKTDYEVNGCPVWVGAGTHDIGLVKSSRSLSVTHKIDPNVDDERDFIAGSLIQSHLIKRAVYVTPSDTIRGAYTATGGKFRSDGNILLLELQ